VLKPCLIHGDLWEGNIGTDSQTGEIFIFDSGAYYAHNEMEIGMECERHKIRAKVYTQQYQQNFTMSEPVEEWDDRNRIYCVKMNMVHSASPRLHRQENVREYRFYILWPITINLVLTDANPRAYDDMCYLVEKYAPLPDTAR
jgi:fructosamine-3-kinase